MGVKGPIPKRSTEGHRITQARKFEHGVEPVNVIADKVEPPEPDPGWHPIAAKLWESVKQSTFTRYYEPSDWIVLYSACDDLSNYKKQERRSPTMLAAVNTQRMKITGSVRNSSQRKSWNSAWTKVSTLTTDSCPSAYQPMNTTVNTR